MKNLTNFTTATLAAIVALASCMKSGDLGNGKEMNSVRIQMSYPQSAPGSRAEGNLVGAGDKLAIQPGFIFFVRADNTVAKHVGIENTTGSQSVTIADLTRSSGSEAVIEDVPSDATRCYVILSPPAGITDNLEGTDLMARLDRHNIKIGDINNDQGDVSGVTVYGVGDVVLRADKTKGDQKPYDAEVPVAMHTVSSRLQIGALTGNQHKDGTSITSFTVEGIYINNTDIEVIGFASNYLGNEPQRTSITNDQTISDYSAAAYASKYAAPLAETPKTTASTGNPSTLRPSLGKAWAYNVFWPMVPQIVIRFSEVTIQRNGVTTNLGTQFITMNTFKFAKSENGHTAMQPIEQFEKDNVYTLENIEFNYKHLSNIPNPTTIDVLVTVTPVTWAHNSIVWEE
jgi:hypothetical protein